MDITELKAIIDANIFENTSQAITGDALNDVLNLIADSLGEYVPVADIFDEAGTIRSALLPSYVDDVLEFSTRDTFPAVGEGGKIYLAADTNLSYRWGGSEYIIIAQSLALGETSSTAYRGDRGKIAYDHSQTSHRLSIAGLEISALGGAIETEALASALSIPALRNAVAVHIGDGSIHITADERAVWNKIASLFGIDDTGDIYIKSDENGRARGLYSYSFVSSAGKSDTPGTGGGTVVGATVGGVDVELIDGVLKFDAYPTAASLGLGNIAFKNSLVIADIANLQSALDGKQAVISDLATIRANAELGAIAHSWDNHAKAGYALASNLTAHTGNSTIHITAAERTSWNNKYDKPASGIPYTDLADSVKSALDKAHEHANKTSVLDKLKWNEDKNAIYIGDENNRINFFVYGGVASGGFSDTPGVSGGTVVGATVGGKEVTLSGGILEFDAYPTTTSLGLKSLAFKDSLSVSEVVGLQSALSNKQDAATAITTSNIGSQSVNYATSAGSAPASDVYAWAKASTKPSYSFSEITSKPTTISGYGITDALTTSNYNSYAPKLDGTGATGTWGINIRGNAATATNADTLDGFHESSFSRHIEGISYGKGYYKIGSLPASSNLTYDAFLIQGEIGYWDSNHKAVLNICVGRRNAVTFCGYTQGLWQRNLGIDIGVNDAGEIVLIVTGEYNSWTLDLHTIQGMISYTGTTFTPADTNFVLLSASNNVSKSLANGTVEKATKLATARTIWGQSFDGTGNVSGALTEVTDITASGNATIAGNVGIGTISPAYRLDVNGSAKFGDLTPADGVGIIPFAVANYGYFNTGWVASFGTSKGGVLLGYREYNNISIIGTSSSASLSILPDGGNVGIGTLSPSAKLHVAGNILATGAVTAGQASDARLKSNIVTVMNACGILRSMRGVEFDWNAIATENCKDLTGHDVGLIAQEVESLIPSAIGTIWGEYKRLDYTKITPYLVEGWKAHDDEIQRLKTKIKQLEERIYELGR